MEQPAELQEVEKFGFIMSNLFIRRLFYVLLTFQH